MAPGSGAVTVALDGFGADGGPEVIASGARLAAADGIRVRVFGPPDELGRADAVEGVEVVAASESISNSDEPVRAVRSRPGASVVLAAGDVAEGRSQALVSAGSTGAAMTAALFALKRLHGVHRPALAVQVPVPGRERPVLLLDAGANTEARPGHLVQFAYLGAAFASAVLRVARPRVGLLSVGEEQGKGTPLVVEAGAVLAAAPGIEFAGNVEGRNLPSGSVDVIVTEIEEHTSTPVT